MAQEAGRIQNLHSWRTTKDFNGTTSLEGRGMVLIQFLFLPPFSPTCATTMWRKKGQTEQGYRQVPARAPSLRRKELEREKQLTAPHLLRPELS